MNVAGLPSRVLTCCRWNRPGGFYRRFERMMLALAAGGTEVHYAAATPFPCRHERIMFHEMQLPLAAREGLLPWAAFFALAPRELTRLAREVAPEAIVAFDGVYGWMAAPAARGQRVPLVVFCRTRPAAYRRWLERRLARTGFRSATSIVLQAECTRPAMLAWAKISPDIFQILPNDVPRQTLSAESRTAARGRMLRLTNFPADSFVAASSGRISRLKGLDTLLEAMARVDTPRVRLVLLGDGPERERYERMATRLGLAGRVAFLGWQQEAQILLAGCDIFITASLLEGSPNALLEALGAGLPCLGGDIPEVSEVLACPELLFPISSAGELTRLWALAASDESTRLKWQGLCRERAEAYTFDWDKRLCETVARACSRPEQVPETISLP